MMDNPRSGDDFVPFEGAQVVRPEEMPDKPAPAPGNSQDTRTPPIDRYLVEQFSEASSKMPENIMMGSPEVLWIDGEPGRREGVLVSLLVRRDVYLLPPADHPLPSSQGQTRKVLTDLMRAVSGEIVNMHRIDEAASSSVSLKGACLAQLVYAVLHSAGQTGRIQNANRWVIGNFKESDDPVESFRPLFDQLWEACGTLRASQPILIVGQQVLSRDDLRLKRLYQRANRTAEWPSFAGSAPDPGLTLSPRLSGP